MLDVQQWSQNTGVEYTGCNKKEGAQTSGHIPHT